MTGKQVQLPWGKATVEEEATIPASAGERPIELGVARLSGSRRRADAALLLPGRRPHRPRPADAAAGRGRGARAGAAQAARAAQARRGPRQVSGSLRLRAGRGRARRRAPRRSPRAPPASAHSARPRSPASSAFESTGKSSPATRCQVPMPPSAAAANGPTCSQRRALPKRTTSSTASGVATPLSTIQSASRSSACCRRFQMKPGTSRCTSTGRLPQLATAARASSTASGRLLRARDHLDERHQQRRIPVVRPDRALGRATGLADRRRSRATRCCSRSPRPGNARRSASAPRP